MEADLGKAIYWFTKGAEGGNDKAMVNLGAAYLKGTGVDQNIPEAVRLFEKAALQMSQAAFYNLALLYREGLGSARTARASRRACLCPNASTAKQPTTVSVGLISAGQPLRHRRCV